MRAVLPGIRLVDIHIFKIGPQDQLEAVTAAQGARYQEGRWVLEGIDRSTLSDDRVHSERLNDLALVSEISPKVLDVLAANPNDLSIRDLWVYVGYLERNGCLLYTSRCV